MDSNETEKTALASGAFVGIFASLLKSYIGLVIELLVKHDKNLGCSVCLFAELSIVVDIDPINWHTGQCRLCLHWGLGTPSRTGPLARKRFPGFPYS